MTPPSIEEGTDHNPPCFSSDVPNTPVTVEPTQLSGRIERQKGFGMKFRTCQNTLLKLFMNDFYVQFCKLFCFWFIKNEIVEYFLGALY